MYHVLQRVEDIGFNRRSPILVGCYAKLPLGESEIERLWRNCSEHRALKAQSYVKSADRDRCLIAGDLLATALAIKYGNEASTVTHESVTPNGQPVVIEYPGLGISITHSGPWIYCALNDGPVGVDVESINPLVAEEVRPMILHPTETASSSDVLRQWTAKESYLKAVGTGFLKSPDSFSVQIEKERLLVWPNGCPSKCKDAKSPTAEEWQFRSTELHEGYLLALCWRESQG